MKPTSRPAVSNLVISTLWALSIVGTIFGSLQVPSPPAPQSWNVSLVMATTILLPIVFFGVVSLFGPAQSPFYHLKLARFINARYGEQAFESFLVSLKPVLLLGMSSILQGVIGLWRNYSSDAPYETYMFQGLFVSSGLAFVLAHIILYIRKAVGIYLSG
jgi:hypothetical protein